MADSKGVKVDWSSVTEIALGVLFAGIVLVALAGLFHNWLAAQGEEITGVGADQKKG